MPAYSGRFDWNVGLVVQVAVVSGDVDPLKPSSDRKLHFCQALVDTGASTTCVSRSVVNELGLEATGMIKLGTAGGTVDVHVYSLHVGLVGAPSRNPDGTVSTDLQMIAGLQAPEFEPGGAAYQVLMGRDILRRGVLNVSFDGHYSFAI